MNASPITAPSSVPRCQCNGHLSKTHKGLEIGECKYDGGKGLFCYVDADQSECCEDESSRYTKYCLSYSACGHQEWKPDKPSNNRSGLWQPDGEKGECGNVVIIYNQVRRRTGRDTQGDTSDLSGYVGGASIQIVGVFPWMALLGYDPSKTGEIYYLCGGSVINKHYILTAAHCIYTGNGGPVEVVLGENIVGEDPDCDNCPSVIRRKINKRDIIVHEGYKRKGPYATEHYPNDIALIRINEAILLHQEDRYGSLIEPICLPWSENLEFAWNLKEGQKSIGAGWGRTSNALKMSLKQLHRDKIHVNKLQYLQLPIANEKCSPEDLFHIDPAIQICAGGEEGKDSCNGDSGGPLMVKEKEFGFFSTVYQIGLVSSGTKYCSVGQPGIYTKVTSFLPWIKSKLQP